LSGGVRSGDGLFFSAAEHAQIASIAARKAMVFRAMPIFFSLSLIIDFTFQLVTLKSRVGLCADHNPKFTKTGIRRAQRPALPSEQSEYELTNNITNLLHSKQNYPVA
jgi:hypothetical protein